MPRLNTPGRPDAETARAARLRRWVVVIGTIAIVANAGVAAYDQWRSYRQAIDDTRRELANLARALAAQTVGNLRTIDVLLRDTVEWYAREGVTAGPAAIDQTLTSRVEGLPQLLWLSIADAGGTQLYRSRPPKRTTVDVTDRSYFVAHRDNATPGLFVSEPIVTRTEQSYTIALSRRLNDREGRFAGVVAAFLDLNWLQRFYHEINLGPHSSILLLRDQGESATQVLSEPPLPKIEDQSPRRWTITADLRSHLGADSVWESIFNSPIDGVKRFVAARPIEGFALMIAVTREERAVLEQWRNEALRAAARTLLLSLLGAFAIVALVRQLRRSELGERALREREERYALVLDGANEGHFDYGLPDGPTFVSVKMRELLDLGPDAALSTREDVFAQADIHAHDRSRIDATFQAHIEGRTDRYEVEYRVRHADGEWRWLLARGRCLRDADGKPRRLVGSAIDITERKRAEAEKERLEAELRKSQKMEAMGTLAGGIAHDFNNILGAILGYGEMAQKNAAEGSYVRRYVDNVMSAGERAKALVERILAFSRSGLGKRAPVNVQAVAEETLELIAASLPPNVRLTTTLEAGDAAVIGDATQLHEVLMNLCTNAYQAMPDGGTIDVLIERVDVEAHRVLSHGELSRQPYVRITVRDSGTGIEPHIIERMFDPFFTTKDVGEGTGLGLSLVHGIVSDVGGAIDVASTPGTGTAFIVWLPVPGSAPPPARKTAQELPRGSGQVIMVVDDEPALVALTEEMLAELGYEPAGFQSSTAALEAFRAEPRRFDLVLSDEMMPQLSGTALAQEIRRLRADIPIVLMSGYSDSVVVARALAAGVVEVLRKPLISRDIADCLARALRKAPGASLTQAG